MPPLVVPFFGEMRLERDFFRMQTAGVDAASGMQYFTDAVISRAAVIIKPIDCY